MTNPPTDTTCKTCEKKLITDWHEGDCIKCARDKVLGVDTTVEKWEDKIGETVEHLVTVIGIGWEEAHDDSMSQKKKEQAYKSACKYAREYIEEAISLSVEEAVREERKEVIERVRRGIHRWSQTMWKENHIRKSNWVDAEEIEASLQSYCAPYREENNPEKSTLNTKSSEDEV